MTASHPSTFAFYPGISSRSDTSRATPNCQRLLVIADADAAEPQLLVALDDQQGVGTGIVRRPAVGDVETEEVSRDHARGSDLDERHPHRLRTIAIAVAAAASSAWNASPSTWPLKSGAEEDDRGERDHRPGR